MGKVKEWKRKGKHREEKGGGGEIRKKGRGEIKSRIKK